LWAFHYAFQPRIFKEAKMQQEKKMEQRRTFPATTSVSFTIHLLNDYSTATVLTTTVVIFIIASRAPASSVVAFAPCKSTPPTLFVAIGASPTQIRKEETTTTLFAIFLFVSSALLVVIRKHGATTILRLLRRSPYHLPPLSSPTKSIAASPPPSCRTALPPHRQTLLSLYALNGFWNWKWEYLREIWW